ncbi:alanine:cation symporter family protein [Haloechinothrix alba]|uniref:alanine:cation symporter family protein n=1 Tax=Haloechinothrix alba TaxID=664784 RepID=UPI0031843521
MTGSCCALRHHVHNVTQRVGHQPADTAGPFLAQQDGGAETEFLARIEQVINNTFDPIANWLSTAVFYEISVFGVTVPWIAARLVLAGFVFTPDFGFIRFRGFKKSNFSEDVHRIVFCAFVVIGSVLTFGSVLDFVDAVLFLLALFNIIGLYIPAPVVKRELAEFRSGVRSREIETVQ